MRSFPVSEREDYAPAIYNASFPVRMAVGAVETCSRMPQPEGLSGVTPDRRFGDATTRNDQRTCGK